MILKMVDAQSGQMRHILNVEDVENLGAYVEHETNRSEYHRHDNTSVRIEKDQCDKFNEIRAFKGGYMYRVTTAGKRPFLLCVNINGSVHSGGSGFWLLNDEGDTVDKLPQRWGLASD